MTASTSESVTIGTYFGYSTATDQPNATSGYTWLKIKNYPDMGGEPNTVEMTDLSDRYQRYMKGVQTNENKSFLANYVPSIYSTLSALSGSCWCALCFGDTASGSSYTPDASMGMLTWKGELSVYVNGGEVDSPREMTIISTPSTKVDFSA